ncbi:MAG: S1-like domain-containing RNA-binding protein [Hymenobacter sp.]
MRFWWAPPASFCFSYEPRRLQRPRSSPRNQRWPLPYFRRRRLAAAQQVYPRGAAGGRRAARVRAYRDSEDRLIATTLRPLALVNSFAALAVRDHGPAGSFLEWGPGKDLLLPFRNQRRDLRVGERVFVFVYLDEESDRLVASAKWKKFLILNRSKASPGGAGAPDGGRARPTWATPSSSMARTRACCSTTRCFGPCGWARRIPGFLRQVRADGKLDVRLQREGYGEVEAAAATLLKALRAAPSGALLHRRQERGRRRVPPAWA